VAAVGDDVGEIQRGAGREHVRAAVVRVERVARRSAPQRDGETRDHQDPVLLQVETQIAQPLAPVRIEHGLRVEGRGQQLAVVGELPRAEQQQREGDGCADAQRTRQRTLAQEGCETGGCGQQRAVQTGEHERREQQPGREVAAGAGCGTSGKPHAAERQGGEERRLEPAGGPLVEVLGGEHYARRQRQERRAAAPAAPPRGEAKTEDQGCVGRDAEHLRTPEVGQPQRERSREQQRPEEVGVALDAFARVVDETVALGEVLGVAQ
jgi:hypothetical protein